MKRKPAKVNRSTKSSGKRLDPFVSGEWIFLDKGKTDMTIRPTTLDLKKLCKKFGYPPPPRKKKR